jgi:hypothetical protein
MQKTILISGFMSGPGQEKKVAYLERLDRYLRQYRHRLFLLNTGQPDLKTTCQFITMPSYVNGFQKVPGERLLRERDLNAAVVKAAAVEGEIRNAPLLTAAIKILLYRAFMRRVLEKVNPHLCVLWHQFNGLHHGLADLCERLRIPVVYAEYGVLPGTLVLETGGQMAESWVARESEAFEKLPVDEGDLERAERLLEYARANKSSRKDQGEEVSIDPVVEKCRRAGRKIVFYAGQNDYQTGMLPPSLPGARLHSPVFIDTLDALQALAQQAERNDWHILFKPHPMAEKWHGSFKAVFPERVDTVMGANIFDCMRRADATVTILSQVGHMALIHDRPSVLLGRNQLSGKGCAYEVGGIDQLGPVLHEALDKGLTEQRRKAWKRHVAQLIRHYVFALEEPIATIIGRDVDEAGRYLMRQCGLPALDRARDGIRLAPGICPFRDDVPGRVRMLKLRLLRWLLDFRVDPLRGKPRSAPGRAIEWIRFWGGGVVQKALWRLFRLP